MDYYEITDSGYRNMLDDPIHSERIRLELLDHFENCIGVIEQEISAGDAGSVVSNNEQGTRRSCSFTLVNVDSKYSINENNFFWFNRKFRLYKGISDGKDSYYFAKGVFITQNADTDSATSSVSISGIDKYGQLDGTLKVLQGDETDTVFEIGTRIEQVIKDILMLDIGNGLVLDPIEPIIDPAIGKQKLYKEYTMSAGSYFGDFLTEIMTSFGCNIFYDNLGRLTVRRVFNDDIAYWYAYKAPVWSFDFSKSGYISPRLSSALTGVNKITVKTDNTDSENASYTAYNNNPRSPLCYSKIGARTLEENGGVIYISAGDETIDTPEIKCKEYAEYRLLKETCLSLSLDFSCRCIPSLNEGDIVLITDPQFLFDGEAFFIQSITDSFDTGETKISAVNLQYLPTDIYNNSNAARSTSGNINKILITYDLNGGTGVVPENELISFYEPFSPVFPTTDSEIPQKYGYEFSGWRSGYGRYTQPDKTYSAPTGNTTLYAIWEKTDNTWFKIEISNFEELGISSVYPQEASTVYDTEYTILNGEKKYISKRWSKIPTNCTSSPEITDFSVGGDCTLRQTSFGSDEDMVSLTVSNDLNVSYNSVICASGINVGRDFILSTGSSLVFGKPTDETFGNFLVGGEMRVNAPVLTIYADEMKLGSLTISSNPFPGNSGKIGKVTVLSDVNTENGSALFCGTTLGNVYIGGDTVIGGNAFLSTNFTEGAKIEFHGSFDTSDGLFLCGSSNLKEVYFYDSVVFSSTKSNICGNQTLSDIYFYSDDITYDLSSGALLGGNYGGLTIHGISGGKAEELAAAKNIAFVPIE